MATAARQLKPKDSIAALRTRVLTPAKALDGLEGIGSLCHMLDLFEHYFPEYLKQHTQLRVFSEDHRRKLIQAFYHLVNDRLFPIADWDMDGAGDRFDMLIPTAILNDDWWEFDPNHLATLTRAILIGAGAFDEKAGEFGEFGDVNYSKLKKLTESKGKPLSDLVLAVQYTAHDTGYGWLDVTEEGAAYCTDTWSIGDIDAIAAVWPKVKTFLDAFKEISKWMLTGSQKERARRFVYVKNAVRECLRSNDERQRVRLQVGVPLVDILGELDDEE